MNASRIALCFSLASVLLLAVSLPVSAAHEPGHKFADGISVFLGVVPAEVIAQREGAEATMHGGANGADRYHVMVALFAGGKRISDAQVTATVGEVGMAMQTEPLQPMHAGGVITYGNYFALPHPGLYRIQIEIRLPGASRSVRTSFDYELERE